MAEEKPVQKWAMKAAETLLAETVLWEIYGRDQQGQGEVARTIAAESPFEEAKALAVQVEHGGCECTCQACFAMRRMASTLLRRLEE